MAYEKYIKKGGKLYGPYVYHSKRVDGKVISEYHGQKKPDYQKFFVMAIGVFVLATFVYFLTFSQKNLTGNAVLGLDATYKPGQTLDGQMKLSLKSGELIPADSKVVVENAGKTSEFNLKDLVSDETLNGSFYLSNTELSGSGEGYGVLGEKKVYPDVSFILSILSQVSSNSTTNNSDSGTPTETTNVTSETTNNETPSAPITGNVVSGFFSGVGRFFLGILRPTGYAIVESENEVSGNASKGNPFTYTLQDNQRAELKPLSVKTNNGTQLEDNSLNVDTNGNLVTVTTNYSETETGFGSEYNGSKTKNIVVDLSKLNLTLQEGNLKISITDSDKELVSVSTEVSGQENTTTFTQPATQIVENNSSETQNSTAPVQIFNSSIVEGIELTADEKSALQNKFGNFTVEIKDAKIKNDLIVVRYELGNYWIEYSYPKDLDNATLKTDMSRDRVKWLKDLANGFLNENKTVPEETVDSLLGNYTIPN